MDWRCCRRRRTGNLTFTPPGPPPLFRTITSGGEPTDMPKGVFISIARLGSIGFADSS
jgi:hypothetical protein